MENKELIAEIERRAENHQEQENEYRKLLYRWVCGDVETRSEYTKAELTGQAEFWCGGRMALYTLASFLRNGTK
jgi:hypothetical protein